MKLTLYMKTLKHKIKIKYINLDKFMLMPGFLERLSVVEALNEIFISGRQISDLKEDPKFFFHLLSSSQRAWSYRILDSVLRFTPSLDVKIDEFLTGKVTILVRNILRLVSCEILIEGTSPYASVNLAVQVSKVTKKTKHVSGLINAVSRKIATQNKIDTNVELPFFEVTLKDILVENYGNSTVKNIRTLLRKKPPIDITLKKKEDALFWSKKLNAKILPSKTLRVYETVQISTLPGYSEGHWWIQDAAAAFAVGLLQKLNNLMVLDLCAAPGGKTMQLCAAGASVTSLDLSLKRFVRFDENLNRVGYTPKKIVADILNFETLQTYDIVLLDPPCSSTGTIRRNVDLQYLNPLGRLKSLVEVQKTMLSKAANWVRPGGRLLYCTCSLLKTEGEDQVSSFLQENSFWEQVFINSNDVGVSAKWVDKNGGMRITPDCWMESGGTDGFYIAVLKKRK